MKYMLQVIGLADGKFAEGEGPTAVDFIGWQRALLDAGVHVDGGFVDDYQLVTSVQVDRSGGQVITNGPFPETRNTWVAGTSSTCRTSMPPCSGRLATRARSTGGSRSAR